MKRIIGFLLTFVMVTSTLIAAPFSAYAYGLGSGGQIGDNVYYTFDESTGAVTVTGTGGGVGSDTYSATINNVDITSGTLDLGTVNLVKQQ